MGLLRLPNNETRQGVLGLRVTKPWLLRGCGRQKGRLGTEEEPGKGVTELRRVARTLNQSKREGVPGLAGL